MNVVDLIVSAFSPESALRRAKARRALEVGERTGYWRQAAVSGTNRKMSGQALDHADSARNHSDRITLIREARHLEENNAIIAGTLRKFEVFVVGRTTYIPRTKSEEMNRQIKAYVDRWMAHADLTGRHSFRALAGLAVKSELRDGDIGFIVLEPPQDQVLEGLKVCPIRLQAIEADRIGATWSGEIIGNKPFKKLKADEQEFSGVVVDKYGRPVRYRIFNRKKGSESMVPWKEVDAQDFIHIFDPIRFDGFRAVSVLDSSANDIKDIHEILACAKQTVKWESSKSGWIEGGDGTPDDLNLTGERLTATDAGSLLKKIDPGAIEHLPAGYKFNELNPAHPAPTFTGFIETLIRLVAQSFKLPYGIVYSWASQGTAVRMESAMADREFQQKQLMLEEKFLNPIVRRVIARGMELGHLPSDIPDFDVGEWRFPAKATADVGRESKADIEEVMAGLRSKTQIAADRGEDREITRALIKAEALDLIEDAKEVSASSGGEIDLKLAAWMLERRGPNAPMEPPEPAEAAPEE
jgi:capsid protein